MHGLGENGCEHMDNFQPHAFLRAFALFILWRCRGRYSTPLLGLIGSVQLAGGAICFAHVKRHVKLVGDLPT